MVPLFAQIPADSATIQQVPTWFWIVVLGLVLGAVPIFSSIVVYFLKRELSRFDSILAAIPPLEKRVTVLEANFDIKREISEVFERIGDDLVRRSRTNPR